MKNNFNNFNNTAQNGGTVSAEMDQGLRSYMLVIYNYMSAALAITGITAFVAYQSGLYFVIASNAILSIVIALAPLGMVLALSFKVEKMKFSTAQTMFWLFSVLMGLSLSYIFAVYTSTSIAKVFFITAATFGSMSIYGYTTKKDLTGFGSFLIMGLIGIIIASIVNLFIQSANLGFAISVIGVLVFVGLTAYDTQRMKNMYFQFGGQSAAAGKIAIMGALSLYLNFINIFIMLLQLIGNRE